MYEVARETGRHGGLAHNPTTLTVCEEMLQAVLEEFKVPSHRESSARVCSPDYSSKTRCPSLST